MAPQLARHDLGLELEIVEHLAVEVLEHLRRRAREAAGRVGPDLVHRFDDVVDLTRQILLRRRELQAPLEVGQHLLLGERVAFDGGRRQYALGEENAIEVVVEPRLQGKASDMLAFGLRLAEEQPKSGRRRPQIHLEPNPWM